MAIQDLKRSQIVYIFQSVMIEDDEDTGFDKLFKNGISLDGFYDMSFNELINLLYTNGPALLGTMMVDFDNHKVVGGYSIDRDLIGVFAPRKRIVTSK